MFWSAVAFAQLPDWENQAVIAINKEPPRTFSLPYAAQHVAKTGDWQQSKYYHDLTGKWSFRWSPDPDSRPREFFKPDADVSDWDQIEVPSNWQLKGYGVPSTAT